MSTQDQLPTIPEVALHQKLGFGTRDGSSVLNKLLSLAVACNLGARPPEGYEDLLSTTALIYVATTGPEGEPQSTPVWFDWDGEHVKFSQTKTRQKYRNLQRDPRLALSLVDPENPYRYLEIRGEVTRIEEDPDLDFINAMAKKYLGLDRYPYHRPGDERVVVYVKPHHTTRMG